MKNQIIKIILVSFVSLCFFNTVYADTTVHLKIETDTSSIYDQDINVAPCDSDNNSETPDDIAAYCALVQSGITSDWSGLWANSINGILNNADNNGVYWMWLVNLNTNNPYSDWQCHQDAPYGCSAKQYILNTNDNILFYYNIDPLAPVTTPTPEPEPTPPPSPSGNSGMGIAPTVPVVVAASPIETIPTPTIKPTFDLKKTFDFLISQQKENGSFREDLYTDWAALALASGSHQEQVIKLIKYFGDLKIINASLTDYERHAMALMALGLNPYNIYPEKSEVNGKNYIEKIITSFDGKQFGDVNEDNDDIFALIVLQNAGYTQADKIINDDISFVLNRQRENGSWDESADMTGAAIEALSAFSPTPGVGESLTKAKEFLKQNQKDNGGWSNASSTAWAIEGILALNEKPEDWKKGENIPLDYLATLQDTDGGIKNDNAQNKLWETAYVVSALSGKTWNQIMQKFEKPETPTVKLSSKKFARTILAKSNTATVINAITSSPIYVETKQETPKKNWFINLLDKIFSVF